MEPYSPDQAAAPQPDIQSVVDRLMAAPSLTLTYTPSGLTSHVYTYTTHPGEDNYINRLADLAADFRWEDAGYSGSPETGSLQIASEDGAISLILLDGSYLVLDGDGHCWKGIYKDASLIEPFGDEDITPFEYLRHWWFDLVEVRNLRVFSVPDRGQSHEDIAREWALSYESALTKAAPGGQFSCTFLRVDNVQADLPQGLTLEELRSLVESHNFSFAAEDFGKLWFGFSYELVFVPENQMAREYMMAGNTSDYEGGDAPEGAMTYSRRGFLWRTDQGWTCREVGTGW